MNILYIGEKKRESYLKEYTYSFVLETYPFSTYEIKEALRIYLENECEAIVGIGNREVRDFVKILGLIGENNYSWTDIFFNPLAITSYPEVIFWAEDILSFKEDDTAYICDFNSMQMLGVKRDIFKDIKVEDKEDIFNLTTPDERLMNLFIAGESGVAFSLESGRSYVDGDKSFYEKLAFDKNEINPVLKGIPYLMPYANNSYEDFIGCFKDTIIKNSTQSEGIKSLYSEVSKQTLILEQSLLLEDQKKLRYLMYEKESLSNELIDEIFKELEK